MAVGEDELRTKVLGELGRVRVYGYWGLNSSGKAKESNPYLEESAKNVPGYGPRLTRSAVIELLLRSQVPLVPKPYTDWLIVLFGLHEDRRSSDTGELRQQAAKLAGEHDPEVFRRTKERQALKALADQIATACLEGISAPNADRPEEPPTIDESPHTPAAAPPDLSDLRRPPPTDRHLRQALRDLAAEVQHRSNEQQRMRQVHDPYPLPVRWHQGPAWLTDRDRWTSDRANPDSPALPLTGSLGQVLDLFDTVPTHRVAVLGPPGSGKSVLATSFVLDFMASEHHRSSNIVPVVFQMASWNPEDLTVTDWMAEQLADQFPDLRRRWRRRVTLAAALVRYGYILPVLDGVDEMSPASRPFALPAINERLSTDPLLLTSRWDQYAEAVAAGNVLRRALVLQLDKLTLDDLRAYLPTAARPSRTGEDRWLPVLDRLAESDEDPVAARALAVLTVPIMASLGRTVYDHPSTDPAELLNSDRFPNAAALANHLLDRLIPSVYDRLPQDRDPAKRKQPQWTAGQAERWLAWIAVRICGKGEQDIAWYRLVPRFAHDVAVELLAVMGVVLAAIATFGGGTVGYGVGTALAFCSGLRTKNLSLDTKPGFRETYETARFLMQLFIVVILVGHLWALHGPGEWTMVSVLAWLSTGFLEGWSHSLRYLRGVADPQSETRMGRRNLALEVLIGGLWLAIPMVFCLLVFGSPQVPGLLAAGAICASVVGRFTSSGTFAWLVVWVPWALCGRIPWRFNVFLQDAYQRGVLRKHGLVYQFRHALLLDRLATRALPPLSTRAGRRRPAVMARLSLARGWLESRTNLDLAEKYLQETRVTLERRLRRKRNRRTVVFVRDYLSRIAAVRSARNSDEHVMRSAVQELREVLGEERSVFGDTRGPTLPMWCFLVETLMSYNEPGEASDTLRAMLAVTGDLLPEDNVYIRWGRGYQRSLERYSETSGSPSG